MRRLLILLLIAAFVSAPLGAVAGTRVAFRTGHLAMADATPVNLLTVSLPTQDTACAVQVAYIYTVTDATDTAVHAGRATIGVINDDGTVTGAVTDSSESVHGTGCNAACDAWSGTVATTTFTATASFNNSLSVTGDLQLFVFATNCTALTML